MSNKGEKLSENVDFNMKNIILFIAASLDGYIARENGDLDWLDNIENPDNNDHGYAEMLSGVDTVLMGRLTYEKIISFGIEYPYAGLQTYIFSNKNDFVVQSPDSELVTQDAKTFIEQLKKSTGKDIWLVGGGKLISFCLAENLIDKMLISIVPVTLGRGIPLFPEISHESRWLLKEVEKFKSGIVNLTYEKKSS